jgi:hypothetical protein
MGKKKREPVKHVSYADYAHFLDRIENYLFSPLLQKTLNFYVWFYTKQQPTQIFTPIDLREILAMMDQEKPRDIDSLAEFVGRLCVSEGVAAREAIRWRSSHLDGRIDKKLLAPNTAVRAVRDCLTCFADAIEQSDDKKDAAGSTTKKP